MDAMQHWEEVYQTRAADDVSWYQPRPEMSLRMIAATGVGPDAGIVDVGAGASTLVDALLERGHRRLTVLDIAPSALATSQRRLGARAAEVRWVATDVRDFRPDERFQVWHDRAVFHFLTEPADRDRYVASLEASLAPGGHLVIATFAADGPVRCSGLEVRRQTAAGLQRDLGDRFELREQVDEVHRTPWATEQRFSWFRLQRRP